MRSLLADRPVVVVKLLQWERSEGAGSSGGLFLRATGRCPGRRRMSKSGPEGKSFQIPKQLVWEAYRRGKAEKGAARGGRQAIADLEGELRDKLFRVWDRMTVGGFFSPPGKAGEKYKTHGGGGKNLGVA